MNMEAAKIKNEVCKDKLPKQTLLEIAANTIRRSKIPLKAKKELFLLFNKKYSRKKTYLFSGEHIQLWPLSYASKETDRADEIEKVIKFIEKIKVHLHKKEEINLLVDFQEEEYYFLELLIVNLSRMHVVSLPPAVLQTNNLCAAPIRMSSGYKKLLKERISYTDIFCLNDVLNISTLSTDCNITNINAYLLFKHILHKGTESVSSIFERIPYISLFEIEKVCQKHKSVFSIYRQDTDAKPEDWMVSFDLSALI